MTLPKRSTWITISLGLVISAIGVYLVIRSVDLNQLQYALSAAHYEWAIVGAVALTSTIYIRTKRWRILLTPIASRSSTLTAAILIGQVLNFLLPFRAGDVVRSILVSQSGDPCFERALGSIAIEKAWDWIALTIILLIATLIAPLPDWFIAPAQVVEVIALFVVIAFAIIALMPEDTWRRLLPRIMLLIDRSFGRLPHRIRFAFIQRLHRLLDSLQVLRNRQSIWRAAFYSGITWALSIAANVFCMHAFGIDSLPAAMLLLVVLMIGVALPPSIAALGIFEGLTILSLNSFKVPYETALAIGLTLHFIAFVPQMIIAALMIALRPIMLKDLNKTALLKEFDSD